MIIIRQVRKRVWGSLQGKQQLFGFSELPRPKGLFACSSVIAVQGKMLEIAAACLISSISTLLMLGYIASVKHAGRLPAEPLKLCSS